MATVDYPPPATWPIAIGSFNAGPACERAVDLIRGGADPIEAVVRGINIIEDDPNEFSVGYGGLPNRDGVVECDACVMDGLSHTSGAVGALTGVKNASSVALEVMRSTDHSLLAGENALAFAKAHGFEESEMTTPKSREIFESWRARTKDKSNWMYPEADKEAGRYLRGEHFSWGTVGMIVQSENHDLYACTSTSGLSFKTPGRIADSAVVGAGLFIDNDIGACICTGRGESSIDNCVSFHAVELMRQGREPEEACLEAIRVVERRTEPRLRNNETGVPIYQLTLYAVRKDGLVGGGALRQHAAMAVQSGDRCMRFQLPYLFAGAEEI